MFGLNCTTFGCELNKTNASPINKTNASRIATTVPLIITQLLNSLESVPGNQSNTTIFKPQEPNINPTSVTLMGDVTTSTEEEVMSTISYNPSPTGVSSASTSVRGSSTSSIQVTSTPTAPATSSIDSSLTEELESAISNVSSIVSTLRHFHVFHCNPALDKWKGRLEGHQAKSKAHSDLVSIITLILHL